MARPWQDRYRGKILQDLATISRDSLKDHGKILAQSWQDLTEFFEDHGKIVAKSCTDFARTCRIF